MLNNYVNYLTYENSAIFLPYKDEIVRDIHKDDQCKTNASKIDGSTIKYRNKSTAKINVELESDKQFDLDAFLECYKHYWLMSN